MLLLPPDILVSLLLTSLPATSASLLRYNATLDEGRIECVYPISGQYALLQRVLYYALLLFSIVSRKTPWLVAGALGAAMTYAASAAVHATILAGISRNSLLDLDCLGIFAIVSVGTLVVTVFFHGSELLRESPARPLFQYWGVLMVVGTICAVVAMLRDYPSEERCASLPSNATDTTEPILLTSTAQLDLMPFNCTYACFNTRQAFRDPSDIGILPAGTVSSRRFGLLEATIWLSLLGAVASLCRLLETPRYYTKDELERILRSANQTLKKSDLLPKQRRYAKQRLSMAQKKLARGQKRRRPGLMTDLLSIACVVVIVLNEVFIHIGEEIPASELPYAVGQWGPWVAVIMALAGSAIVEYHRPAWEERQRILKEEGLLAQGDDTPSLFSSAWMRLRNLAGSQSSATKADPGAEIVQWPGAAWRGGLHS